jgi:uncharacterized Zn-binding protein involved in type VI secretion
MGNMCHRDGDNRNCGATTIVSGQNFVKVNGKLWSVLNDKNTHGDGELTNTQNYISINGKYAILVNDTAQPDDLCGSVGGNHCHPIASSGDALITIN